MGIMRILELVISSGTDRGYTVSARSDSGDTKETPTQFPFDERELARHLRDVEFALVHSTASTRRVPSKDEKPVQELGRQLFSFLFPDAVRDHLTAVRSQAARDDAPLQVRLRIRPPELAALPWEFLYDPGRDEYLSLHSSLVRYLEVLEPLRPLAVTAPLRVLAMIARPGDLGAINVGHEKRRLHEALAGLEDAGLVELTWTHGQTWHDLQDALDEGRWNIFHFIGHGGFDSESQEGILALAGEDGGAHRIAASDLGLLLGEHRSLRLAVLNSCEGARASTSDVFSSTASVLTRRGIPAVVAMQYDISDEAAIAFARGLYGAVANRLPVDRAVTRARRSIKLTRRNTLEWATPVLYLRSPEASLFDLTAAPTATAIPPQPEPQAGNRPEADPARPVQRLRSASASRNSALGPREPAGSLLSQMPHGQTVWAVAFSPEGSSLATGCSDGTARLWDTVTSHEVTRMPHGAGALVVFAVAFSPDGSRLATGGGMTGGDNAAWIWNPATGRKIARMPHRRAVRTLAFSLDGTRLATASEDYITRIWDLETGREVVQVLHEGSDKAVVLSPDGTRLATAGGDTARLWDTATGREVARMPHDDWVQAVAISADGTRLATASNDHTAGLWDTTSGREVARMRHGDVVWQVAFSPDGTRLATTSNDGTARLWDTASGREVARMRHGGTVVGVAFSPDGTRLATHGGDYARDVYGAWLWDTASGREIARLPHRSWVQAMAFSPDGTSLATGSSDNTARMWAT